MNFRDIEKYLYRYSRYKADIVDIERQYAQLARREFGDVVQTSGPGNPTLFAVMALEHRDGYREAVLITRAIEKVMDDLHPAERRVIRETYLEGQNRTMEGRAMRANYCRVQCWRIRKRVVPKFAKPFQQALKKM